MVCIFLYSFWVFVWCRYTISYPSSYHNLLAFWIRMIVESIRWSRISNMVYSWSAEDRMINPLNIAHAITRNRNLNLIMTLQCIYSQQHWNRSELNINERHIYLGKSKTNIGALDVPSSPPFCSSTWHAYPNKLSGHQWRVIVIVIVSVSVSVIAIAIVFELSFIVIIIVIVIITSSSSSSLISIIIDIIIVINNIDIIIC